MSLPRMSLLAGLGVLGIAALAAAQDSAFVRVDLPLPVENAALGVAPDGKSLVGWTRVGDNTWAIRWTELGGTEALGELPGGDVFAEARATTKGGELIVGVTSTDLGLQAFMWTPKYGMEVVTDAHMPTFCSAAHGVSQDGRVIVGQAYNCGCGAEGRAFRWSLETGFDFLVGNPQDGGGLFLPERALGVSADGSVIVGAAKGARGTEAFYWTERYGAVGLGDLPGGMFYSVANAVSADGSTVVGVSWTENGPEAFRYNIYEDVGMTSLGDLPDGTNSSRALAVCADGSVIVGVASGWEGDEAFVWDRVNGMRPLKEALESAYDADLEGWRLVEATGVCNQGRVVVGWGINPMGHRDLWMARLPAQKQLKLSQQGVRISPKR